MKEVDYLVIGLGVAGISYCEQLRAHEKRFLAFDTGEKCATAVSGGTVNPVVLKRFTPVWNVEQFLPEAASFYQQLANRLQSSFMQETEIHRILNSVAEQQDWLVASDKKALSSYLSSEIIKNKNTRVKAPFDMGGVWHAFKLNTGKLLKEYRKSLSEADELLSEAFDHSALVSEETGFQYKNIRAQKIIFAEGSAVVGNPYFTIDGFIPKKGEYLIIKAPELKLTSVLKGAIFVIPLGDDLYKIGATFDHSARHYEITDEGRSKLVHSVEKIIDGPFEVVDQIAGMRPTVKDRRPLLGSLSHENILFFNGLGTRGLLSAPLLSKWLYDFAENNRPLPSEVDIKRFH